MLFIFCALGLCLAMIAPLRGVVGTSGKIVVVGLDGVSVITGFLITLCAAAVFGPLNGLSLIFALMLHQAGHVVATRLLGIDRAEFCLLPGPGNNAAGLASINRDLDWFFHSLMGPALSIPPMVLSFALAEALTPISESTAAFLWSMGVSIGVVNALALLPFRTLDGGRCIRALGRASSRTIFLAIVTISVGLLVHVGILIHSWIMHLIALIGVASLFLRPRRTIHRTPMTGYQAMLALSAYLAVMATHMCGAWLFMTKML